MHTVCSILNDVNQNVITLKDGKWDSFSESATLNAPLTLHTGIAQAGFRSYRKPSSD